MDNRRCSLILLEVNVYGNFWTLADFAEPSGFALAVRWTTTNANGRARTLIHREGSVVGDVVGTLRQPAVP